MEERREAPRVSVREIGLASSIRHVLVSAFRSSRGSQWDNVIDLSAKGVSFVTDAELDAQQELLLTVRIDAQSPGIEVAGSVVRVSSVDDLGQRRVGVQFTDYKEDAWKRLRWFENQYANGRKLRVHGPRRRRPGRKTKNAVSGQPGRGDKMVRALSAKALR